jgi:hypothetical protein
MTHSSYRGINEASRSIKITAKTIKALIIYYHQKGKDHGKISFHELAGIVYRHDDPISQRFSEILRVWADAKAGLK